MTIYVPFQDAGCGGPSSPPEYEPPEVAFTTYETALDYINTQPSGGWEILEIELKEEDD